MATAKRTVRIGALRRTRGIAKGKTVRSISNVRRVPRGTDARPGNKIGTRGSFSGGRVAPTKGNIYGDNAPKQKMVAARRKNRALLGGLTSPYRFFKRGRVGSRQG